MAGSGREWQGSGREWQSYSLSAVNMSSSSEKRRDPGLASYLRDFSSSKHRRASSRSALQPSFPPPNTKAPPTVVSSSGRSLSSAPSRRSLSFSEAPGLEEHATGNTRPGASEVRLFGRRTSEREAPGLSKKPSTKIPGLFKGTGRGGAVFTAGEDSSRGGPVVETPPVVEATLSV